MSRKETGGKNIDRARKLVEARPYKLEEAASVLKKAHFVKFDETVELVLNLGVDPKQSDQMVRGTVVLPHGLGKSKRVLVIASGEKVREAQDAGADFVGGIKMPQSLRSAENCFAVKKCGMGSAATSAMAISIFGSSTAGRTGGSTGCVGFSGIPGAGLAGTPAGGGCCAINAGTAAAPAKALTKPRRSIVGIVSDFRS